MAHMVGGLVPCRGCGGGGLDLEVDLFVEGGRGHSRRRKRQQQGRVVTCQTKGQPDGPTGDEVKSDGGVLKSRQELKIGNVETISQANSSIQI